MQIDGRDEISILIKVEHDVYYLQHQFFLLDMKIIGILIHNLVTLISDPAPDTESLHLNGEFQSAQFQPARQWFLPVSKSE